VVGVLHVVLSILAVLGVSTLVVLFLARLFADALGRRGW
jgi:hypothetical protein